MDSESYSPEIRDLFVERLVLARQMRRLLADCELLERTPRQLIAYADFVVLRMCPAKRQEDRLRRQITVLRRAITNDTAAGAMIADLSAEGFEEWQCTGWQGELPPWV
jgi:hypothetical protein